MDYEQETPETVAKAMGILIEKLFEDDDSSDIKVCGNVIKINFHNGQKFTLTVARDV